MGLMKEFLGFATFYHVVKAMEKESDERKKREEEVRKLMSEIKSVDSKLKKVENVYGSAREIVRATLQVHMQVKQIKEQAQALIAKIKQMNTEQENEETRRAKKAVIELTNKIQSLDYCKKFSDFQYQQIFNVCDDVEDLYIGICEIIYCPTPIALVRIGNDDFTGPKSIKEIFFDDSNKPFIFFGERQLFIDPQNMKSMN